MNILMVALGGAFGAVCRYGLSKLTYETSFPVATFITNIIGALVIGFIVGLADEKEVSEKLVLFIKTGFCGGFTTFSTFSLESVQLLENHKYVIGVSYMTFSLILCLVGVILGRMLAGKVA